MSPCVKFGASVTKWTILPKFALSCPTAPGASWLHLVQADFTWIANCCRLTAPGLVSGAEYLMQTDYTHLTETQSYVFNFQ